MKKSITLKTIFAIITVVLLVISQILPFVNFAGMSMQGFIVGSFIAFLISFVFLYSVIKDNLKVYIFSIIAMVIGYGWTFLQLYRLYHEINVVSSVAGMEPWIKFDIGFYIYVFSCIFFVICVFVKNPKKISESEKQETGPLCLVGFYRFGIPGDASFINHSCSITLDQAGTLQVMIASLQVYRHEIQNTQIQGIYCYPGRGLFNMATYQTERSLLSSALVGRWGSAMMQSVGPCIDSSISYLIEIHYLEENEIRKVVFEFAENPDFFFQYYQNRYQKVSSSPSTIQ